MNKLDVIKLKNIERKKLINKINQLNIDRNNEIFQINFLS